ncbi:MAG: hypothetical protein GY847_21630 [Proteobacteria bacterium]|nr:hypothetical protein [Pseudomonadota bacterium]
MYRHAKKLYSRILVVLFVAILTTACPNDPNRTKLPSPPMMISRGNITASLNRYIETSSNSPFEQFGFMGMFARYDVDKTATANILLNDRAAEIDLALDTCTMPSPVLHETHLHEPRGKTAIELLDVGDLTVSFNRLSKPVPTRTFPDLLKFIVGVIYSADETQGVLFRPGETYALRATGTDEVAPFQVILDAPEDLGDVKVEGVTPGEQVPFIRRDEEVELIWEGDGYGDEVIATLNWTSMGAPWSMTCRMRDDGLFVVPSVFTAGLPDPLTCSDHELTLSRIRQVAFRTDGLSSGSFKFIVSINFPVAF